MNTGALRCRITGNAKSGVNGNNDLTLTSISATPAPTIPEEEETDHNDNDAATIANAQRVLSARRFSYNCARDLDGGSSRSSSAGSSVRQGNRTSLGFYQPHPRPRQNNKQRRIIKQHFLLRHCDCCHHGGVLHVGHQLQHQQDLRAAAAILRKSGSLTRLASTSAVRNTA